MRRDGLVTRRPSKRGGEWSPKDISGLVLWLDNTLVTVTAPDDVTAWPDLSGAGNHFTQASTTVAPTYVTSETDFPVPQPAVKFDVSDNRLVGPAIANLAWLAVVAVYPGSTFADFSTLIGTATGNQFALRGASGTAAWRTVDTPAGNRFVDRVDTDTALTTPNTPHLYEFVPTSAWTPDGALWLGGNAGFATRIWSDSVCLVLGATAVPSAADLTKLHAYVRGRGMVA